MSGLKCLWHGYFMPSFKTVVFYHTNSKQAVNTGWSISMVRFTGAVLVLAMLILSGCQVDYSHPGNERVIQELPPQPIVVRASGFGTVPEAEAEAPSTQARLLARRASQLDALRNLTERVYGTGIYGETRVSDYAVQGDYYRAYVDGYIRGARVESVIEHEDGVVETTLHLKLEPGFQACVANILPEHARGSCGIPLPGGHDGAGAMVTGSGNSGSAPRDAPATLYFLE
ncbi:MAG: hypothetical protein EA349_01255 [Halomonadaceae bacterium]|nr:MAG: hypothetical protein EA349_01255 [Halomonadaceae bacterium]